MKTKILLTSAIVAATLLAGTTPALSQSLTAYVVHGIPGEDLDMDMELPVDIAVGDLACLGGIEFGDRLGPLDIPSGAYDITVSLADADGTCQGTAVLSLPGVELPAGVNATIVAHRTADGSPGAGDELNLGITASIFSNDFTATARGKGRLIAHHTALAPAVDVVVSRDYSDPTAPGVTVPGFSNPTADEDAVLSQINAEFRPGEWQVALELEGATVFGPDTLQIKPYTAVYVYAVGDFFGETFQYLVFTEEGLKSKRAKTGPMRQQRRSR